MISSDEAEENKSHGKIKPFHESGQERYTAPKIRLLVACPGVFINKIFNIFNFDA